MKKIFTTLMILGASLSSFSQKLDTVYRNAGVWTNGTRRTI
jgi:hypothetical protein